MWLNWSVFETLSVRRSRTKEEAVLDLHDLLHEKDMKLTDIRLEALSSAHQLDQLKDTMTRMKVSQKVNRSWKSTSLGPFNVIVSHCLVLLY